MFKVLRELIRACAACRCKAWQPDWDDLTLEKKQFGRKLKKPDKELMSHADAIFQIAVELFEEIREQVFYFERQGVMCMGSKRSCQWNEESLYREDETYFEVLDEIAKTQNEARVSFTSTLYTCSKHIEFIFD